MKAVTATPAMTRMAERNIRILKKVMIF
jgi:hypothetical protein